MAKPQKSTDTVRTKKSKDAKPAVVTTSKSKKTKAPTLADGADRYALYRLSVQDPEHEVNMFERFYKDAFGKRPTTLREDFCAAAAVCCEWVQRNGERRAWGVDLDPEPLAYGRAHYLSKLSDEERSRVTLLQEDVLVTRQPADIIAAQNFSFFLFKTREALRAYFASVHESLNDDGILIMDMMGGGAMHDEEIEESRSVKRPTAADKANNSPFRYVWEQARFNPITHDVLFHIHFRFPDGSELDKAFTYDWRLWTLPELRELLTEAGFSRVDVYWENEGNDRGGNSAYKRSLNAHPQPAWLCYMVAVR
jgi:hypothetical protein